MTRQRRIRRGLITTLILILIFRVATPAAHERRTVGQLQLTIGWSEEPVFSGSRNAVELRVADLSGVAVNDPEAVLTVEVSFGEARITVPLRLYTRAWHFQRLAAPESTRDLYVSHHRARTATGGRRHVHLLGDDLRLRERRRGHSVPGAGSDTGPAGRPRDSCAPPRRAHR